MDVIFLDSNLGQGKYVLTLPTGSNHLSSRVYNGKVYHRLYQFVPFVMISLSVLFYLPRYELPDKKEGKYPGVFY